ncbi:Uncharacterized membrane protein [Paenibacillus algorifonticola]|uniref:Uncharacterized membrane protein n=2 Tax=Paenibacillus algorifonticola TaxID=684063 RepID=A0A1I2BV75_9BACL|nr:Uncharacterized membrane protein [Paenibacillus algorifonticola]
MKKNIWTWLIIALSFIAGIISYSSLPATLPVHWNALGEPDRYTGKMFALFLIPALMVLLMLLFKYLPKIDPKLAASSSAIKSTDIINQVLMLGLAALQGFIIAYGYGVKLNIQMFVIPFIGILFITIGNYLPRMKPNRFVGIKTPLTLNNEQVWRKTHQLSAKIFFGGGFLIIVTVFLPSMLQLISFLTVVVLVSILSVISSVLVAKKN